jgi:hypothetical protein
MVTLSAKISLVKSENAINASTDFAKNNISPNLSVVANNPKIESNPFILGGSPFGKNATAQNSVDYFVSSLLSDENGNFPQECWLVFTAANSGVLTIEFDKYNNYHPTYIEFRGKQYFVDDAIFTFELPTDVNSGVIYIRDWNAPNRPLVIQGIYSSLDINIDYKNLIDAQTSMYDRGNFKEPDFGVFSNDGVLSFNDKNGEVKDYVELGLLTEGASVDVYINNSLAGRTPLKIGKFYTQRWEYDNDNKSVSVRISDDLLEWQNISISPLKYSYADQTAKSFAYIYEYLYSQTSKKYNMPTFAELDTNTQNVLNSSYIKYPFVSKNTLWSAWQKLCEVCQLHIYKDGNGMTVCKYNGGN